MKLAVEVVVVVDVAMDVDVDVVEVVSIRNLAAMRIHLATMGSLEGSDHLKREIQGSPLKGVAMVLRVVHSVVDDAVALAMERLGKGNVLEGHMNVAVVLDVGKYFLVLSVL